MWMKYKEPVVADRVTVRTHTGFLKNLTNSFVGVLIGVLLFFGSFILLWINEGRTNPATIARTSTAITTSAVQPDAENLLVAATGTLETGEMLGDAGMLRPADYLWLQRTVEMYAWREDEESRTRNNTGGSSTTETVYTYKKVWTTDPENSDDFHSPSGHENPRMPLDSETWKPESATLGAYRLDPGELELPGAQPVPLSSENVEPDDRWVLEDGMLFNRPGAQNSPRVGDVRVTYQALANNLDVTLFAQAAGDRLVPYQAKGVTLFRAFTEDREAAIATYNNEFRLTVWLLRLGGFLMMWFGLMLGLSPINAVLNILPPVGKVGGCLMSGIMFAIAAVLSAVTILVAILAHNLLLMVAVLLLIAGGLWLYGRRRHASALRTPSPTSSS
jgi:hypothetical protein